MSETLARIIERNREEAGYMVSMDGKEARRDMCMDYIARPDATDHPPCPACTSSLCLAVLLQRDDNRLVMCPHCGWETYE
jgi:predicted RNA-binding Zn-ribbon protein involved in translation (DUF1610 family)